jgi:hypothetical protein
MQPIPLSRAGYYLRQAHIAIFICNVEVSFSDVADALVEFYALQLMGSFLIGDEAFQFLFPFFLLFKEKFILLPSKTLLLLSEILHSILNQRPSYLLVFLLFFVLLQFLLHLISQVVSLELALDDFSNLA